MQGGSPGRVDRRLAAIVAADVVGYSRLMEADEVATARTLGEHRSAARLLVAEHGGRIVKTTGDGVLIEFPSVVGAVQCAVAFQNLMAERNTATPSERRMEWRVGIHLGDILIDGEDILGDGVNLAARLEGIAEPGGICISEDAYRQVRGKIETAFLDDGDQALKNITRPVRIYRAQLASVPVSSAPAATMFPRPENLSIAVLPFQNMSGDPEQEYFADGMVEEIITALSRIRWLFVIARNSTFTYKGQAVDVKQVGRELGVRYILEGSVRKGGNRVRITAQLIEAESGAHIWAERFDGSLEDVFDLQDQVAASVAGVIEPALQAVEAQRSSRHTTNDLDAYDRYLRAYAMMLSPSRSVPQLAALLDQAIGRDPDFGPALALAATFHMNSDVLGWAADREDNRRKGVDRGRRALRVAGDDPAILANAALALGYFGEDINAMMALVDRALALNPSFARAWHASGCLRLWAGQPDLAIEHAENSLRLSPRTRVGWGLNVIGAAHFVSCRFDEAIPKLLLSIEEDPNADAYQMLIASYSHSGKLKEARDALDRVRSFGTVIAPNVRPFRNPDHKELLLSGLRLAVGKTT